MVVKGDLPTKNWNSCVQQYLFSWRTSGSCGFSPWRVGCLEERGSGDVVQCRCASVWPVDGGLTSRYDDMPERGDQQAVAV